MCDSFSINLYYLRDRGRESRWKTFIERNFSWKVSQQKPTKLLMTFAWIPQMMEVFITFYFSNNPNRPDLAFRRARSDPWIREECKSLTVREQPPKARTQSNPLIIFSYDSIRMVLQRARKYVHVREERGCTHHLYFYCSLRISI